MKNELTVEQLRKLLSSTNGKNITIKDYNMVINGSNDIPNFPEVRAKEKREYFEKIRFWFLSHGYELEFEKKASDLFKTKRRFRYDIWVEKLKLVIEINGGQWGKKVVCHSCKQAVQYKKKDGTLGFIMSQGLGHNKGGKSYEKDLTKANLSQINGLLYLSYTYEMIKRGECYDDFLFVISVFGQQEKEN